MRALFVISLRRAGVRPARVVLSVLGIACGVALFVAISMINASTSRSFGESMKRISGKAALVVSAGETGFGAETVDRVAAVPGVAAALPLVETRAWLPRGNESIVVFGVDLLSDGLVRDYEQDGKPVVDDSLEFIAHNDSILVTDVFARERSLRKGDRFELATAHGKAGFTVRGILPSAGIATAYGGELAVMDIDAARIAFGKRGKVDRIDVVTQPGASVDAVEAAVRKTVGPGLLVERPQEYAREMDRMVSSFQFISWFFSLLSLVVGVVFISNSVAMAVAERRREIGALRAIGATRRSIFGVFLLEVLLIGGIASCLGALGGSVLARGLVGSVTRSMTQQFQQRIDASALHLTLATFVGAMALGMIASVLGAILPAVKAMRIQPLEAMRSGEAGDADRRKARSRIGLGSGALGLALFAGSAACSWWVRGSAPRWLSGVEALGGIAGAALLGPALMTAILRELRHLARDRVPMTARLALDNLLRNPRRTGANVISLLVGLILVVVLSCMNASFKGTLLQFFDRVLRADLVISSTGRMQSHESQPLSEDLKSEIEAVPGVLGAMALQEVHVNYGGETILLKDYGEPTAGEDPSERRYDLFDLTSAGTRDAGETLFRSPDPTLIVSDNFTLNFHKSVGDTVELPTPRGLASFRIVATARDFASPAGTIMMSRANYRRFFDDRLVSGFAVKVRRGYDPADVRRALERALSPRHKLTILLNGDIRGEVGSVIDSSFAYTDAIKLAALLVALFGLLNTMLVSILERKRELGMARAIGMTRGQVRDMILVEAASQGLIGAAIAVALGVALGGLWVKRNLADSLGWIVDLYLPWPALAGTLALGVAVTLLAAWYPARRAARLEIVEAIDYE